MLVQDVPKEFQTFVLPSTGPYPPYGGGRHLEEVMFERLMKAKNDIKTTMVYLPIFWTSYYLKNGHDEKAEPLLDFLENLDKSKTYFTIVQYASGIFVRNFLPNLYVFSAGGGGQNKKSAVLHTKVRNAPRSIFIGELGDCILPLIANNEFPFSDKKDKRVYCSFVGNFDTHECRYVIKDFIQNNQKECGNYNVSVPYGKPEEYIDMTNSSVFTLAPRGYGYTSFRLYEAILGGSIPVYIWEDHLVLPYQDKIDWGQFCIIIHTSMTPSLPTILKNCNVERMQAKLKEMQHVFKMDYLEEYVKEILSKK